MLSDEEKEFLDYWSKNRLRQKRLFYQLLVGLPIGLIFGALLLMNFLTGRFWYKRADSVGVSQFNPLVLIVAVLLIVIFIAVFSRKHQWDMNEQRWLELKSKEERALSKE